MHWYLTVLKKYSDFDGRSHRREYWTFVLINLIIGCAFVLLDYLIGFPAVLSGLYALVVLLPGVAVAIRRLHDTGRSAWWLVIGVVPFIGAFILLAFVIQSGTPGQNRYGLDPKMGSG